MRSKLCSRMPTAGQHAQLSLRRTGGLAGVPMRATLDTRELAPEQAREVLDALDSVDLERVGKGQGWPPGAADTFHYDLEIDRGAASGTASFSDRQLPAELAPVVRTLMDRAQPAGGGE
jgi:hypothetical protein